MSTAATPEASALMDELSAAVDRGRLVRRTLELLSLPSPSGEEGAVADAYGRMLTEAGLTVELDREFRESPSVVARTPPVAGGAVLQLAGHLDTISTVHAPPSFSGDVIAGRGACDMKGGLAAMAEAAQVLTECGALLGGSLLVTAHGQHEEAASGRSLHAPLLGLLRRGIMGSACIIAEGPHEHVPVAGRGLIIFKATFTRPGDPVHEILGQTAPPPNPVMACHRLVRHLEDASVGWTENHPLAGTHSFFIGATNGGDYYNRIGSRAEVWGTRRYPPGVSYTAVRRELEEIAGGAAAEIGCAVELDIQKSGQPFSVRPEEPVVVSLRRAHLLETGRDLPLGAMAFSADSSQFINVGGIPSVYHGTNSATAHADHESVGIGDVERCAKVIVRSIVAYLGLAP